VLRGEIAVPLDPWTRARATARAGSATAAVIRGEDRVLRDRSGRRPCPRERRSNVASSGRSDGARTDLRGLDPLRDERARDAAPSS
jgi:hypothetical protein